MTGSFQISTSMPDNVTKQLSELLRLYGRPPPPQLRVVDIPQQVQGGYDYDDYDEGGLPTRLPPSVSGTSHTSHRHTQRPPSPEVRTATHFAQLSSPLASPPASKKRSRPQAPRHPEFTGWQWGPEISVNNILSFICPRKNNEDLSGQPEPDMV
jgi:hypothetical protein